MMKEREEATCLASWSLVSISVGWQREWSGCVVSERFMWETFTTDGKSVWFLFCLAGFAVCLDSAGTSKQLSFQLLINKKRFGVRLLTSMEENSLYIRV